MAKQLIGIYKTTRPIEHTVLFYGEKKGILLATTNATYDIGYKSKSWVPYNDADAWTKLPDDEEVQLSNHLFKNSNVRLKKYDSIYTGPVVLYTSKHKGYVVKEGRRFKVGERFITRIPCIAKQYTCLPDDFIITLTNAAISELPSTKRGG